MGRWGFRAPLSSASDRDRATALALRERRRAAAELNAADAFAERNEISEESKSGGAWDVGMFRKVQRKEHQKCKVDLCAFRFN